MQNVMRAILGGALLLTAATACSDDPLSGDRDQASYFFLNPTVATVKRDSTIKVTATLMNQHGAPTGGGVAGTPCDAKVTAAVDPTRSAFEEPERFLVKGIAVGASCLVVSGGGLQDTVTITVQ
jgi:hypothetical protein